METKKVLIVDDSATIRQILTDITDNDSELEVVGTASDPYLARERIKKLNPDVITLDIEMPRMDGITFLRNIMRLRPMPVVMISTLTEKGADVTLEALELGAIDYVAKPKLETTEALTSYRDDILRKVKTAANANLKRLKSPRAAPEEKQVQTKYANYQPINNCLITIGASTGGTEAIRDVLVQLPENCPPIVITQHIPPMFSRSFAERLNRHCAMTIQEAKDGVEIKPGNVYIAPGDSHFYVDNSDRGVLTCRLDQSEPVNRHRPSVDVLFDSVTKISRRKIIGIILTGMGGDGAKGLLHLKNTGALTVAQDEASSVVWGMPGVAVQYGAASKVLPLNKIADYIVHQTRR